MRLADSLFDLSELDSPFVEYAGNRTPWEWLDGLAEFIKAIKHRTRMACARTDALDITARYDEEAGPVIIGKGSRIQAGAMLIGPVIIGENVTVAYGSVVRDGAYIMDDCRVGHGCEVTRSILMPKTVLTRHIYLGDSVVGRDVSIGAGSNTAHRPIDRRRKQTIVATWKGGVIDTGREKLGALVGDAASIGNNVTLVHGAIIGRRALISHGTVVSGTIPSQDETDLHVEAENRLRD